MSLPALRPLSLALLLVPTLAAAASGDALTGSGSSASGNSAVVQEERAARAKDLRSQFLKAKKDDTQYREQMATYRRKRAEHRRECRENLRRANRDTQLSTLLDCFKADLSLEQDFVQNEQAYLSTIPLFLSPVRRAALDRGTLLEDALHTVIFAIDSGVYRSIDDVQEARANVTARYRVPFRNAFALARADQTLSIVDALLLDLDAVTLDGEDDARRCLEAEETNLRLLLTLQGDGAAEDVSQILPRVQVCRQKIHALRDKTGSGVVVQ